MNESVISYSIQKVINTLFLTQFILIYPNKRIGTTQGLVIH